MRSPLAIFRPAIPCKVTRSFSREMRWAAKTLDRARDLDVHIDENLSSKAKKQRGKMHKLAIKHRERAYDQVAHSIQGERYRKVCDELRHWVEAKGWRVDLSNERREVIEGNVVPFTSGVLDDQRTRALNRHIGTLNS
jgi:hypothetical protein